MYIFSVYFTYRVKNWDFFKKRTKNCDEIKNVDTRIILKYIELIHVKNNILSLYTFTHTKKLNTCL